MSNQLSPELFRVIDANLNRLREGIRVVEDIIRYRDNNKELSSQLKLLRHRAKIKETLEILKERDSVNDVLRSTIKSELNRTDISSIIIANFKRAEESARVLEELFKLYSTEYSENFKYIRYELYRLEKEILT
ncbi:MAG: thiamine-phosphate pyrophosphorylase [Sulfurimonas sp.]|uniref:thiamine-phosphate pyrophosphorylase n=1 Tax=unclassified Sulfurimonas TaxID=2623549 RepID=UPI0008D3393B|nr:MULTISPECIES: thiamine-phosphate pyrophosphorylase [unclassified Sulfurimonas]OHE08611.1 MAG: thiamine-phosphate pyrophosphorylase [Sulfurimonas sp. RIFOXYC2_FULL_36_7]OHE17203.1 MAG: thiamine-phosphate pyrophosphorylase [Sulfurimonas sp. RIFOXYD12_FULL_36_11]MBS4068718.1 thiamine-phosphate pyrophosphorylase [Sulfurimonas sp.]MDD3854356.1 thiamine-phosphate pyrophosphorylase [Sulfurimonas sp.]MDX9757439.1 thiamine-phosphate pyrophosphorylase [Sulfurimonas sp.]